MKDRASERPLPEHKEIMDRFARKIIDWRMTAPAVLFLESAKPLSFLGNQALIFFQPMVQSIFNFKTYDEVVEILEDRDNLEYLLSRLEQLEAERTRDERDERNKRRQARRGAGLWRWTRAGSAANGDGTAAGDAAGVQDAANADEVMSADGAGKPGEAADAPKEGENE
ncbi:MAG: hypothetical protein JXB46_08635 [Candidatus Eisenbacteria bacterium]|nr:hypothetical protein [Candidatus Eisenbacteria bacterium]